jgi:hypothetical protein
MRLFQYLAGAALVALFPVISAAQGTTTTQTTTTTTTTQETFGGWMNGDDNWIGSAFIGSNFAADAEDASLDFGGSIGYLWRGSLGAEFQANFSPDFSLEGGRSALLLGEEPWINSYMVNAIAAIPIGTETRWQPYVSGGLGALTLRADAIANGGDELEPDSSRFGGNIGAGLMAYMGNFGVRGDVRYFRGFEDDSIDADTPGDAIGDAVLSDLSFWRANIGLAFRW